MSKLLHKVYFTDGNEETVEIDGKKFIADPADASKPKVGEDGKPIEFVEKKTDTPIDLSKVSLEDLKKVNPDLAKMLSEAEDARIKLAEIESKRQEEEDAKLKEAGKWQELAEKERAKAKEAHDAKTKAEALLGKYQGTVQSILDSYMGQLTDEKKALIPKDYSIHNKLEYILENAKFLGISVVNKGGEVPKNDASAPADEEGKVQIELNELMKKTTRTYTEDNRMIELAKKLKEIRANKTKSVTP